MNATQTQAAAEQAMEQLDQSETRYRKAQEHLTATQDQIQRNRKALELARQEADDLNREWKQLLRESGGQTTKAVLEKLEASRNARDVAQELVPILETAPEILEAAEVEAITAREEYLKDLKKAQGVMITHEMFEAIEAAQALPEFQNFIVSLSQYVKHNHVYERQEAKWSIGGEDYPGAGSLTADDLKVIEASAKGRTCAHLMEVMQFAGLREDIEPLPGLEEVPETDAERNSPLKRSTIELMRARKRLAKSA